MNEHMKSANSLMQRLTTNVVPGTVIPKPAAKADFIIKGWGMRRGEKALIYLIPCHGGSHKPHEKGVTESEFLHAYDRLIKSGVFTREWFNTDLVGCAKEGGCNFTTIGGIFILLGVAQYSARGQYTTLNQPNLP